MAIEQKDSKMTTTDFDYFIESIGENSMMYKNSPIICPHGWREYWGYVEKEIRGNLFFLSDNIGRVNYLEFLLESLTREFSHYNSANYEEKLNALYIEYNITEEDIATNTGDDKEKEKKRTNFLYVALRNSRRDLLDNGKWVDDYFYPRNCFFGYHLFSILSKAIEFVNERKEEIINGYGRQNDNITILPDRKEVVFNENENQDDIENPTTRKQEEGLDGQGRLDSEAHDSTFTLTKTKRKGGLFAFNYEYNATRNYALENLMNYLIDEGFLKTKTNLRDFKRIFSGVALNNKSIKKVEWIGALNELRYFILLLSKLSHIKYRHNMHWTIAVSFFNIVESKSENHIPLTNHKLRNNREPKDEKRKKLLEDSMDILEHQ